MTLPLPCVILFSIKSSILEHMMRYEGSQSEEKPIIDHVLAAVNFFLVIVIAFCINYMFIGFLFR